MDRTKLTSLVGQAHVQEVEHLTAENEALLDGVSFRNPKVTLILAIFLGLAAIDRLYQGGIKLFFYKLAMLLLTLGTWWIVDIGYSIKITQELNYQKIISAADMIFL